MGFLQCNLALAPRQTKEVAYKTLVCPQLEYAAPIWNPYHKLLIQQVEKVQRIAARWTCRRWRSTSSVSDMLDKVEWPSLEDHTFNKIHSSTMSLDKDKYLIPAPNLRRTRASHDSQYTRYLAYTCSDALKNSFFSRTIPLWYSLPSSVDHWRKDCNFGISPVNYWCVCLPEWTGMGLFTVMDYRNGHWYVVLSMLGQSGVELPQKVISPRKMQFR